MQSLVRRRLMLLMPLCLFVCGCTYENEEGVHYSTGFSWWVPLTMFGVAIGMAIVGWRVREKTEAAGWILMLLSVPLGLFLAPSLALNGSVVDDEGFRLRGGLLGMTYHQAKFAETSQIKHTYQDSRSRYGDVTRKYYLVCNRKDGSKESFELSSAGSEKAGRIFVEQAKAKGIMVTDETIGADLPLWMKK